jgi:hypothetical protein
LQDLRHLTGLVRRLEDFPMGLRPSDDEMQRLIAELLKTPRAGRAVAGHLSDQTDQWAQRAAIGDLRARRLQAQQSAEDDAYDRAQAGGAYAVSARGVH